MPEPQMTSDRTDSSAPLVPAPAGTSGDAGNETDGAATGLSIVASKISRAMPARSVLSRPRLVEWFGRQPHARLILVSAEAGYGKSTLLNEFALQTNDRCVWYRMESSDGDWITFLSHMVVAFREISPGFGRSTEALLRNVAAMGSTHEVVLAQFLADLSSIDAGRVAVILDDYHYVETSDDVRMILSRMLERAPESMYVILGGRGKPNLSLGRLNSQGRVAELTMDDLRFTRSEIEELFSVTYGQPLDERASSVIAERTEGWAASLQLVAASIAVSRPHEVMDFIEALSGATGPVYDFLAEEVLTRLSPDAQRILVRTCLIDRVRPELVVAAISACQEIPDRGVVESALDMAEALGLLTSTLPNGSRRIHPLFREFLQVQLEREEPAERIRAMHRAIAAAAEPGEWLVAARHYALAGVPVEAMRVLGSEAGAALGAGAWGTAVEIVGLMPDTEPPAAVKVIQARALISDGFPDEADALLTGIDRRTLGGEERGLVGLTSAAIHHINGRGERVSAEVGAIAVDESVPAVLREVALTWQKLLQVSEGGCISDAVRMLRRLAVDQQNAGLHYFAGVTLHNLAYAELARGNYQSAVDQARQALVELRQTDDAAGITAAARSIEATAIAEMGNLEEGLRSAGTIATEPGATADAIADAAYLHAVCGRGDKAQSLLARFSRGDALWSREVGTQAQGLFAHFALSLAADRPDEAHSTLAAIQRLESTGIETRARGAVVAATLAVVERTDDATRLVNLAIDACSGQEAWRWMARARILDAVVRRDGRSLALWVAEGEDDSALAVLELADAISVAIGTLSPLPPALERSILREPTRWIRALSRQVRNERTEDASAAASLVARFGSVEDIEVLREYERSSKGKPRRHGYTTQLIRRVSPTVRIHDLGLTSYEVGTRLVTLTETRRKSAALLLYFVTRPDLMAQREQVLDSLWPDQSPRSAMNSLHQTLFFLRRDIEPWYEDGSTADYVRMESDLVFLDQDLFQIDSVAFVRQASDILATRSATARGPEMLRLYKGSFAPEFEYEEWSEDWRTHVHGVFLHLAHATAEGLFREGRYQEVVEVLVPVVALDPTAYELRAMLIAGLAATGAVDAAHAHYRSMASAYERDLGLPARSYDEIVRRLSDVDE